MSHWEIRLSGSGGQGLITAGIILAEAALLEGMNALQSQSYGPEARGGASKAEVIISENEITFPKVGECDLLLSLTQLSCDKYIKSLKKGGTLVIDDSVNPPQRDDITIHKVKIIETSDIKLKKPMVVSIVALGVINAITKMVKPENLEKAVLSRVPKGTEELNKTALKEGYLIV